MTTFTAEDIVCGHLGVANRALWLGLRKAGFLLCFSFDPRRFTLCSFAFGRLTFGSFSLCLLLSFEARFLGLGLCACFLLSTLCSSAFLGGAFCSLRLNLGKALCFFSSPGLCGSLFTLGLFASSALTFGTFTLSTFRIFACGPLLRCALVGFLLGLQTGSRFLLLLGTLAGLLFGARGFFGCSTFTGGALSSFCLCLQAGSRFLLLLGAQTGLLLCKGSLLGGVVLGFQAGSFRFGLDAGNFCFRALACSFFVSRLTRTLCSQCLFMRKVACFLIGRGGRKIAHWSCS